MLRANPDCSVERAAERASLESLATAGSGVAVGNVYVYSLCCLSLAQTLSTYCIQ